MVENWTNLPEGVVSTITSYIIGCEGWRRLKQCDALRDLQRKWKPSIYIELIGEHESPEMSLKIYILQIHNKKLKVGKHFHMCAIHQIKLFYRDELQ